MNISDSTVLIPLTQGQFAIIDALDAEFVNQWKWCASNRGNGIYYVQRGKRYPQSRKSYNILLHRAIMERMVARDLEKQELVDHVDRNPLNNTRANLRIVDRSKNAHNCRIGKNNTSGVTGVTWNKKRQCWMSQIQVNYKNKYLGLFSNIEDAITARRLAEDHIFDK